MTAPATADRVMLARGESTCPVCQRPIMRGQQIGRCAGVWQHIQHIVERITGAAGAAASEAEQ